MTIEIQFQSSIMFNTKFFQVIIGAGLALLLLLPVGTYVGVESTLFIGIFSLHLILLFTAAGMGLLLLKELWKQSKQWSRAALALGTVSLLFALLESRLPITFRDALIHHLTTPRWWLEEGRIFSPSWHEWSFYPMLINLGFTGLLSLGFDSWVASYHWIFGFLFCAVVAQGTSAALKDHESGAIAFFIAATTPNIFRLCSLPIVDCGLALYCAIAFFLMVQSLSDNDSRILGLSGIALGLALGCKYNALPFALSSVLIYLLVSARPQPLRAIKSAAIISLIALAVYSPWLARNYTLTSNPIYPLYSNIFKPSIHRPAGLPNLKPIEQRLLIYHESPLEIALLPFRIFFDGKDDQPARFDGVLSPLLVLSIFGFLFFPSKKIYSFSIGSALFYLLLTIFLNPLRIRYLVPILTPLIFLTARGIRFSLTDGRTLKAMIALVLAIHLYLFGEYATHKIKREELFSYLSGQISEADYLRERIPEYPVIEYINQNLSSDKKIYLLFTGNRFALYKPQTFSGGHYSASVLIEWIRASEKSRIPLIQFFHDAQINYVMSDSLRAQQFVLEQLNEVERSIWTKFVTEHLKFAHEDRGFSLWQVVNE